MATPEAELLVDACVLACRGAKLYAKARWGRGASFGPQLEAALQKRRADTAPFARRTFQMLCVQNGTRRRLALP